jgi:F-type H+-transporting ATPase subunit delta
MANARQDSAAALYARAIFDLANQAGIAGQIAEELADLARAVASDHAFGLFMRDAALGAAEKRRVLGSAFGGRVHPLLFSALGVMNRHDRLGKLAAVADNFQKLLDAQLGNVPVQATVAEELDAGMVDEVRRAVSEVLKKNAVVSQKVDAGIIGGLVLRMQDKLIDGSVRTQLELLKRRMLSAAP